MERNEIIKNNISIYKKLLEHQFNNSNKYKNDIEELKDYLIYKSRDITLENFCETFFSEEDYSKYIDSYKDSLKRRNDILQDIYNSDVAYKIQRRKMDILSNKRDKKIKEREDLLKKLGLENTTYEPYLNKDINEIFYILNSINEGNKITQEFINENMNVGVLDKKFKSKKYEDNNKIEELRKRIHTIFKLDLFNELEEIYGKIKSIVENQDLLIKNISYYDSDYIVDRMYLDGYLKGINRSTDILSNIDNYKYKKDIISSIIDDLSKNKQIFSNVLLSKRLNTLEYYNSLEKENKIINKINSSIVEDNAYLERLNEDEFIKQSSILEEYFEQKIENIKSFFNAIETNTLNDFNHKFYMHTINDHMLDTYDDIMCNNLYTQ